MALDCETLEKESEKVCKFGGTSLATENSFELVKNIVLKDKTRKYIVASAQGKRFVTDTKVTDLLILLNFLYANNKDWQNVFEEIKNRHLYIRDSLYINIDIEKEFEIIKNNMPQGKEYLLSRGEYLNAKLLAKYLNFKFLDAKEYFIFESGKIDIKKSVERLKNIKDYSVIGGFYGTGENGKIELLSRGGGDISGAIFALSKGCDYENFTDTSGIFDADPKIVKNARKIENITYDRLYIMSLLGAKVIHKSVAKILKNSKLTMRVLNTFSPNDSGTIVNEKSQQNFIALAIKNNAISLIYSKPIEPAHINFLLKNLNSKKLIINFSQNSISIKTKKTEINNLANFLYEKLLKQTLKFHNSSFLISN